MGSKRVSDSIRKNTGGGGGGGTLQLFSTMTIINLWPSFPSLLHHGGKYTLRVCVSE